MDTIIGTMKEQLQESNPDDHYFSLVITDISCSRNLHQPLAELCQSSIGSCTVVLRKIFNRMRQLDSSACAAELYDYMSLRFQCLKGNNYFLNHVFLHEPVNPQHEEASPTITSEAGPLFLYKLLQSPCPLMLSSMICPVRRLLMGVRLAGTNHPVKLV